MNATDLLAELRPPLDESPTDDGTLERILLAAPEPTPMPRRRRAARPLAVAGATAVAATAGVALVPSGQSGPGGLAGAVAALTEPDVLLHFRVTSTHSHSPSGARRTETAETWQTPDGRRMRALEHGLEIAYDQRARTLQTYVPGRDVVIADTDPEFFDDEQDPFGSIATPGTDLSRAGDLPALVERALSGDDPKVRFVGRTTLRGIDVDHIRIERDVEVNEAGPGASLEEMRNAPRKTVTIARDVYVRHDDALPVRVVDHQEALGGFSTTSDYTDVQKLTLDASSEPTLELADHPGAKRTTRGPFDDSKAGGGR